MAKDQVNFAVSAEAKDRVASIVAVFGYGGAGARGRSRNEAFEACVAFLAPRVLPGGDLHAAAKGFAYEAADGRKPVRALQGVVARKAAPAVAPSSAPALAPPTNEARIRAAMGKAGLEFYGDVDRACGAAKGTSRNAAKSADAKALASAAGGRLLAWIESVERGVDGRF